MTRTTPDLDVAGLRSSERVRTASIRPGGVLRWAGAVALVVAGGALATVTFTDNDEGVAETPTRRADTGPPACAWVSQVDGPFFPGTVDPAAPGESLGPAPTPDSVLVFERCDGEWTGDIAWLDSGVELAPLGDDGMPNPWEAGNHAVERLEE
ncbi:MAG: hypothetical protein ACRD0R_18175 [Acidimicrobiales bacterium]